jgi:hypothetical protein
MVAIMGPHAKGKKIARFDWLVLPLCPRHGREQYVTGLDRNVRLWETLNGTQLGHLCAVAEHLGVNVWELAGVCEPE